ncbi:MAG: hypothetical protein M1431_06365 [Candidatus Thermoplasmatota archaeon]|nr:hypothetical protein [Candidatus Thermoplasmatota archaeon]
MQKYVLDPFLDHVPSLDLPVLDDVRSSLLFLFFSTVPILACLFSSFVFFFSSLVEGLLSRSSGSMGSGITGKGGFFLTCFPGSD